MVPYYCSQPYDPNAAMVNLEDWQQHELGIQDYKSSLAQLQSLQLPVETPILLNLNSWNDFGAFTAQMQPNDFDVKGSSLMTAPRTDLQFLAADEWSDCGEIKTTFFIDPNCETS
jgi:hypothetical protein